MPIKVTLRSTRTRGKIDAAELVTRRAEAGRDHLSRSILDGVSPVDGTPRPKKADGRPLHLRTGRLGRNLRLGRLRTTRGRASITIELPRGQPTDEFREAHVAKHDDILTTDGRAGAVLADATRDYLEELRNP